MDIRKNLFRALELKYEADKQVAKANLDVLLEYQVGVADHPKFIETIDTLFEHGKITLLIDMTHIRYLDSSGLWALFESHKKATQKNGKLVLINPTKDVKRVLDITKMSTKIDYNHWYCYLFFFLDIKTLFFHVFFY